ncbi:MAG: phospholipid carrier-dependent glycosyltransferase [Actinomycetaceae bacterium]|nr:phospholipid carrier-dependent glycosyltransferase [Actinomycetaceae bacterium]
MLEKKPWTEQVQILLSRDVHAWVMTLLAGFCAALVRLPGLGRVTSLSFDETYYVKDAYALWTLGFEGKWGLPQGSPIDPENKKAVRDAINGAFANGDFSMLSPEPAYVVHPQTGKWLIGLGMQLFGPDNPVGWRITAALAGIVCVILICRIAWHLFYNHGLVLLAGMLLAGDGVSIVLSRTALLDVFLTVFSLGAFLAVVLDYRSTRPILARRLAEFNQEDSHGRAVLGPHAGARPWLITAGVLSGLAISVKWSGLYVLAVLGLFVVSYEITSRYGRLSHAVLAAIIVEGIPAFLLMVPSGVFAYIASWWSWFTHSGSWGRNTPGFLGAFSDFIIYHQQMFTFHSGLSSEHAYMSSAPDWLIQRRPTSFVYNKIGTCGDTECVQAVLALGNPLLWWIATLCLVFLVIVCVLKLRNGKDAFCEATILAGYLATYVPWFAYLNRTTFNFYTVVIAPFAALTITWAVREAVRFAHRSSTVTRNGIYAAIATVLIAIALATVFFYPVWTGMEITRESWQLRMWLHSWI